MAARNSAPKFVAVSGGRVCRLCKRAFCRPSGHSPSIVRYDAADRGGAVGVGKRP